MEAKLEKWTKQTKIILSNLEKAQELTDWKFMQTELKRAEEIEFEEWPGSNRQKGSNRGLTI